jgi:predicted dehydrogenase
MGMGDTLRWGILGSAGIARKNWEAIRNSGNGVVSAVDEEHSNHPDAQETKLFRNFARLALCGTPDPFWPELALKTQRILDACLASARNGGETVTL